MFLQILFNQSTAVYSFYTKDRDPEPEIDDELATEITPLLGKYKISSLLSFLSQGLLYI